MRDDHRVAEIARQLLHIISGLWAYLLRWLTPTPLMILALSAAVFNRFMLPRIGGRWLWRQSEVAAGRATGVVLYPLTILLLLGLFYRRPEVAAAGWGLLAFADGSATLAGRLLRTRRLPWNATKTWAGFLAYCLIGWAAVFSLVSWVAPGRYEISFLFWVAAAVAGLGAFLESAPQKLDDNLGVPLVASIFLWCCLVTAAGWQGAMDRSWLAGLLAGLGVNTVLVVLAVALGTLDKPGAVVAGGLGTLIWSFLSWPGYMVLLVFFVLGSASTKIGYRAKLSRRVAQERGGRRRAANALANGGVATACAIFAGVSPDSSVFTLAFACSLGAAAADTVESEIGQIWGHPTVLISNWRAVAPGTDGGVSAVGTAAGLVAATATIGAGWLVGLVSYAVVIPLSLLALGATVAESLVGATLERSGWLDNNGVNLVNTLLAALLGAGWAWIVG